MAVTRLRFWWQRRRCGLPVKLGTKPSGIRTYSAMAFLSERETFTGRWIRFTCPSCRNDNRLDVLPTGRIYECPHCGVGLDVEVGPAHPFAQATRATYETAETA